MALQIGGTTVIDNNRQLQNISSLDATTATAMGNAGVGGISSSTSSASPAFSYTGANYFSGVPGDVIATTTPATAIIWATHTVGAGVSLLSAAFETASSGFTTYRPGSYYGVTVGLLYWDGSQLTIKAVGWPTSAISSQQQLSYIQDRRGNTGVFLVSPGDKIYAVVLGTYHPAANLTGGAAWAAGKATLTVSEIS